MRKSLLFLPILLLLTGCIDDQKQQEARCENFAVHQVSRDRAAFMLNCMEAAGYRWSWKHGTCPVGISTETNPYCYRPENRAGRVGFSIEIWLLQLGLLSSQMTDTRPLDWLGGRIAYEAFARQALGLG